MKFYRTRGDRASWPLRVKFMSCSGLCSKGDVAIMGRELTDVIEVWHAKHKKGFTPMIEDEPEAGLGPPREVLSPSDIDRIIKAMHRRFAPALAELEISWYRPGHLVKCRDTESGSFIIVDIAWAGRFRTVYVCEKG